MLTLRALALTFIAIFSSLAAAQEPQGTSTGRQNGELTSRVKAALMREDSIKAAEINVETRDGVVQLSGFVSNEKTKRAAEAAATKVSGVKYVQNALIVGKNGAAVDPTANDAVIEAKVRATLAGDASLAAASDLNIEVENGVVQLSGFVSSMREKSRAAELARGVEGVRHVRDGISVQR